MTRPIIVGEAPSLKGDGRPFTGPSGERLCQLLDIHTYDQLTELFELRNLFDFPQVAWDRFGQQHAKRIADRLLANEYYQGREFILAGKKVMRAFGALRLAWYTYEQRGTIRLWAFPHPSGLSHYWNEVANREAASAFLKDRAFARRTDHPSEHIPLDLHNPQAPAG